MNDPGIPESGMRHASPASEALASVMPSVRLLVGVMTFNHTGRAARRAKIRQLCHTGDSSALFFVIPADSPDVDTDRPDMLRLHVPAVRRGVSGKYLLQNAYFRSAAASLPKTVRYVARMDDDAIVNAAAIEAQLRIVDAARERDELVFYGPFRNWCPLAPASPACPPHPPARPARLPASAPIRAGTSGMPSPCKRRAGRTTWTGGTAACADGASRSGAPTVRRRRGLADCAPASRTNRLGAGRTSACGPGRLARSHSLRGRSWRSPSRSSERSSHIQHSTATRRGIHARPRRIPATLLSATAHLGAISA